jgi:hypothetical protein
MTVLMVLGLVVLLLTALGLLAQLAGADTRETFEEARGDRLHV